MPYQLTAADSGLQRTTGLPSGDWTAIIGYNITGTPGVGIYRTAFALLDALDYTYTKWNGIFSQNNNNSHFAQASDGVTIATTSLGTIFTSTQYNLILVRKGTITYFLTLAAGGAITLIGSATLDLSAITWARLVIGNDGENLFTGMTIGYYRDWSAALEMNELYIEVQSNRAVRTTDLISDCPFETDLNDVSGNGNHFSDQGTVGTFTTSVPTPDYTVTTFPYSQLVPQAVFNVSNLAWFKVTISDVVKGFSVYCNNGGNFSPRIAWYKGDGVTLLDTNNSGDPAGRLLGPGDYYIKITKTTAGTSNFDFTVMMDIADVYPNFTIPAGALLVNDDSEAISATVLSSIDGFLGFLPVVPSGELGTALPNGITLWHDRYNYDDTAKLKLIAADFSVIAQVNTSPSLGSGSNPACLCNNGTNFFILRTTDNKLWKLTSAGVITDTGIVLPGALSIVAIAVDSAEEFIYFVRFNSDKNIYKYEIATNTTTIFHTLDTAAAASDVYWAYSADGNHTELIILSDGSIVTTWQWLAPGHNDSYIIHVGADGILISTNQFTGTYLVYDHLNPVVGNANINIWLQDTLHQIGKFGLMSIDTITFSQSIEIGMFSTLVSLPTGPTYMFGPSESCAMLTYLYNVTGGIYKIVPGKRNDTVWTDIIAELTEDVKIPDPYAKTALLGD